MRLSDAIMIFSVHFGSADSETMTSVGFLAIAVAQTIRTHIGLCVITAYLLCTVNLERAVILV